MNYILYFDGYDNDTYFYKTIKEMVKYWECETLEELINKYKKCKIVILKIEKVIYESCDDSNE